MGVMAFRQQIAGADVKKEARENRQDQGKAGLWKGDKQTYRRAKHRCESVKRQPAQCKAPIAAVFYDDVDSVQSIRKVVHQNRDCNHNADGPASLKSDAYGEAVQQTVRGKAARSDPAARI